MAVRNSLDIISVVESCAVPWSEMAGDDHSRFCGKCQRNVYDLSSLTREAAEELVARREGRLCVRFYRREDGTLATKDCSTKYEVPEDDSFLMGDIEVTLPRPVLEDEAYGRDLLLATVARSLRGSVPDQAESLLVVVERALFPPTSAGTVSGRCPHCERPLRISPESSRPEEELADREALLARLRQSLDLTHPAQTVAILREANRRDVIRDDDGCTVRCSHCNDSILVPPLPAVKVDGR